MRGGNIQNERDTHGGREKIQRYTHRDTHLEIEAERPRDREKLNPQVRDGRTRYQQEGGGEGQKQKRDPKTERHRNTPRARPRETRRGERGRHTYTSVNSDTCAKREISTGSNRWERQRDPD